MEYTSMLMEADMKAIGRMIYKKDLVLKYGLMAQNMRVSTQKVRKMDKEVIFGMMDLHIQGIG